MRVLQTFTPMRDAQPTVENERAKGSPAFHVAPGSSASRVKRLRPFGPLYEPVKSQTAPGKLSALFRSA